MLGKIAQFSKEPDVPARLLEITDPEQFLALLEGEGRLSPRAIPSSREQMRAGIDAQIERSDPDFFQQRRARLPPIHRAAGSMPVDGTPSSTMIPATVETIAACVNFTTR